MRTSKDWCSLRHHGFLMYKFLKVDMHPIQDNHKCTHCRKSFKSSNGLKYHIEKTHSDEEYSKMSGLIFNEARTKPPKAIPPALDLDKSNDFPFGILEEFAFIATGPQSPLVQEVNSFANEAESPGDPRDLDYNIPSVESDASATSPLPTPTSYRHPTPPPTAWSCFLDGTRIQLEGEEEWKYAEDLGNYDIPNVCDPNDGLMLTSCERIVHVVGHLEDTEILASFSSTSVNLPSLRAEVAGDHPFFVKNKGWSSFQPSRTLKTYGMESETLMRGDVCLPSSHPIVMKAKRTGKTSNMFDFTDQDSNAASTLSSMAKDRQKHRSRQSKLPSVQSVVSNATSEIRQQLTKRPMNAFMLFAKKYRLKITKAHPGKDNRAISVILGDQWKSMKPELRSQYVLEAKRLAEEHKKVNPDCWKRKRNVGQGRTKVPSLKRL